MYITRISRSNPPAEFIFKSLGMILSHRSPGFLSSALLWREKSESDNLRRASADGSIFLTQIAPGQLASLKEEPSSSSTQGKTIYQNSINSLSPCAIFPTCLFPGTSFLENIREEIGALCYSLAVVILLEEPVFCNPALSYYTCFGDHITLLNTVNHILSLKNFSKHRVFTIQVRLGKMSDEKLAAVGIGSGIGH